MVRHYPKNRNEVRLLNAVNKVRKAIGYDAVKTIPVVEQPLNNLLVNKVDVHKSKDNQDIYFEFCNLETAEKVARDLRTDFIRDFKQNVHYVKAPKAVTNYVYSNNVAV